MTAERGRVAGERRGRRVVEECRTWTALDSGQGDAAPDGTVWLPSNILSPTAAAGYDVIDHNGRLAERVHLAVGQKLLGFGKGVVYVSFRDSTGVTRVGRVPLH